MAEIIELSLPLIDDRDFTGIPIYICIERNYSSDCLHITDALVTFFKSKNMTAIPYTESKSGEDVFGIQTGIHTKPAYLHYTKTSLEKREFRWYSSKYSPVGIEFRTKLIKQLKTLKEIKIENLGRSYVTFSGKFSVDGKYNPYAAQDDMAMAFMIGVYIVSILIGKHTRKMVTSEGDLVVLRDKLEFY